MRRDLLVYCAANPWDSLRGTDQQMAHALTQFADVLYVDPVLSPKARWGRRRATRPRVSWRGERLQAGLVRITPPGPIGPQRRGLRVLSDVSRRYAIVRFLTRDGRTPSAVIASSLDNVLSVPAATRVLYETDDYLAGAALMGLRLDDVRALELARLAQADLVVAVSDPLSRRLAGVRPDVVTLPNGVDVDHFQNVPALRTERPRTDPRPAAVLMGHLNERIDVRLLEATVDAGLALTIVGPRQPGFAPGRFEALLARPGVAWLGRRRYDELPGILGSADVGLTPYVAGLFNDASVPLKTLEYLAAGLPVVSSDLPAARALPSGVLHLASSPEEFAAAAVKGAAEAGDVDLVRLRQQIARQNSWASRAEHLAQLVGLTTSGQATVVTR